MSWRQEAKEQATAKKEDVSSTKKEAAEKVPFGAPRVLDWPGQSFFSVESGNKMERFLHQSAESFYFVGKIYSPAGKHPTKSLYEVGCHYGNGCHPCGVCLKVGYPYPNI